MPGSGRRFSPLRELALLWAAVCLSGCVAGYTVAGVRYRSANAALKAQASRIDEQLAGFGPMPYVGGSVLVPLPPDSQLTAPPFADRHIPRVSPEHSFLARYWRRDIGAAAEALGRSEAFDSVEVRRADDAETYARDYGYRFVLHDQGPRWFLEDLVAGQMRELHGVGLRDLAERARVAASFLAASKSSPAARTAPPASGSPETVKGGYTLSERGDPLAARASILARVRQTCSGSYRLEDEFLLEGSLTLRFACLGEHVSSR